MLQSNYKSKIWILNKNLKHTWNLIKYICNIKCGKTFNIEFINIDKSKAASLNLINNYFTKIGHELTSNVKNYIGDWFSKTKKNLTRLWLAKTLLINKLKFNN